MLSLFLHVLSRAPSYGIFFLERMLDSFVTCLMKLNLHLSSSTDFTDENDTQIEMEDDTQIEMEDDIGSSGVSGVFCIASAVLLAAVYCIPLANMLNKTTTAAGTLLVHRQFCFLNNTKSPTLFIIYSFIFLYEVCICVCTWVIG